MRACLLNCFWYFGQRIVSVLNQPRQQQEQIFPAFDLAMSAVLIGHSAKKITGNI